MTPSPTRKAALVVHPDAEIVAMLAAVLDAEDWDLERAEGNAAALAAAEERSFELIITGQQTSGKEDVELLRKIRRVRPHTRLIILTDESTPTDVINAMRAGAFSYFAKPFSAAKLSGMIRMATESPCWDDGIELISATPEWIRLQVRCERNAADRLIQFMEEVSDLPEPEKNAVAVAFRELLTNAIEHGGRFDPNQHVEISYLRTKRAVSCRIKDPGEGFSASSLPHAAASNPEENPIRHLEYREEHGMRPGGYGMLLAKRMVDELLYGEKGNEVLLVKYLPESKPNGS